jgi:tRNA A37 methylthiotransferase MiaB
MKDDVPEKIKKERHAVLLSLQKKISAQLKEHKRHY